LIQRLYALGFIVNYFYKKLPNYTRQYFYEIFCILLVILRTIVEVSLEREGQEGSEAE